MKILIIEDNPTNMKLASDVLRRIGKYEVIEAMESNTGIALAQEHLPELILMDIQMPGIDGFTATRMLKSDKTTRHINIIALTALAMKGDKERIFEAGCDGYISKPIRYKELLEAVANIEKGLKDKIVT